MPRASRKQFRVWQYVDNTTSFVKDFHSLVALFDIIAIYKRGSGAKLNRSKTEAMWLGAWREHADQPLGLTWVRKMKILGVFFCTVSVIEDNWQPRINKLEKSLSLWKSHSLSLVRKSLLVNVLGLSKFFYVGKIFFLPRWVLARVNALIWPFFWGSKIATVSRNTCYLPVLCGGLNIVNLELKCVALRLSLIFAMGNLPEDPSFFLFKYFFGSSLAPLRPEWHPLRDNLSPSGAVLSSFYSKCLDLLPSCNVLLSGSLPLSTENIYCHFLKTSSSSPILPGAWTAILGPSLVMKDHWARV